MIGVVRDAIAADLDGDCDDDLVIATSDGPPVFWLRSGAAFLEGAALDGSSVDALAAADLDRDGDVDLITGAGTVLRVWRNDGSGAFTEDPAALSSDGRVQSIRALGVADLDGDGNPDLVVGQAGDPLRAWLGDSGGSGSLFAADAVISPVSLDDARLTLADVDGDFDPDLAVAVAVRRCISTSTAKACSRSRRSRGSASRPSPPGSRSAAGVPAASPMS